MFSFENPISLRLREQLASGAAGILQSRSIDQMPMLVAAANTTMDALKKHQLPPHASHPSFIHLAGLVSEAVLEVVFVALPGSRGRTTKNSSDAAGADFAVSRAA